MASVSPILDGAKNGPQLVQTAHAATPAAMGIEVERLIGDQPARWFTLAGTWLAVAFTAGFGLFVNFRAQGGDVSFAASLMAMIPHYVFWVIASPPIYRALHKTLAGRNRMLWLATLLGWSAIALAGSTVMSYFSYITRHGLEPGIGQFIDIYVLGPAGPAFWGMNCSILVLALTAFAGIRGLRLRDQALWRAAQAELGRARLEAQLAAAQFAALQAQINPHFLFNSLNAISGLVETGERERATDAIGQLGELLQITLRNSQDLTVTLGDEVDFLQRYLELCKLRFDSSFNYCISVPESLRARTVPALIVQPLIENAIRHGMESGRVLHVAIRAYAQNAGIVIEVEDDGCGISAENARSLPAGHGLANVRERLRLFFGTAGDVRLAGRQPRGTRARIVIGGAGS